MSAAITVLYTIDVKSAANLKGLRTAVQVSICFRGMNGYVHFILVAKWLAVLNCRCKPRSC